jgi:two-component system, cell cycle sensor histidine kinase and response regulator CckA
MKDSIGTLSPGPAGPPPRRPLRLLLAEDSEADAELLLHALGGAYDVSATRVFTAADMQQALASQQWDIVVSDYSMPGFTAPDALALLRKTGLDIPFIIVSGTIGEETAVTALKAGACDFLVKGRLARLVPAIERELRDAELRRERLETQQALEEQLRQSQKMEAIGQLAGGVAHDFNNMLTAILGYAELLSDQIGRDKPISKDLREIVMAAERATALTRQLLAFGRKQNVNPVALSLNTVVEELEPMLRRLISANVEIRTSLARDVPAVLGDALQLDQVLMNLAVNARDAMPRGGSLTIETRACMINAANARRFPGAAHGSYSALSVSDTGVGMSGDVIKRIFEPFFTTKERGQGTGLGLAAVYGIVKQLGGYVYVDSELGRGTTFRILLPATDQLPDTLTIAADTAASVGNESVLVVEDEPGVRSFARSVLERHGYRVIEAESSEAALECLAAFDREIDLLVTDVMLTGINGGELASQLRRLRPALPVLFMSGYADPEVAHSLPSGADFLQKPFSAHTLLSRVRHTLEAHDHPIATRD